MDNKKKKLLSNTIMLYILTFSTYFFGFILIPYQTRVLGPEYYGKIAFAIAFSTYFQLVFDYGFILSATENVSKNRNNKDELGKILSAVNILKLFLIIVSFFIFLIICKYVDRLNSDFTLYLLYFVYVSINAFLPDFLYRGIEEMKIITYRSVIVKLLFTMLIFIFLKNKSQYYIIPVLNIIGAIIALLIVYIHVYKNLKIKMKKVSIKYIYRQFKESTMFFLSRIASTLYGATNTFILGFIYPTGATLGLYSSADKLITTAKSAFSPISDSIYPYMVKNKDYKLIKKILKYIMPLIIIGCTIVFIFSKELCTWFLGKEYQDAYIILRLLMPIVVITLPNYLLGFPTLAPLGISKYANISVMIGSLFHISCIGIMLLINKLNVYNICIITVITESLILLFRLTCIIKVRKGDKKWKEY